MVKKYDSTSERSLALRINSMRPTSGDAWPRREDGYVLSVSRNFGINSLIIDFEFPSLGETK